MARIMTFDDFSKVKQTSKTTMASAKKRPAKKGPGTNSKPLGRVLGIPEPEPIAKVKVKVNHNVRPMEFKNERMKLENRFLNAGPFSAIFKIISILSNGLEKLVTGSKTTAEKSKITHIEVISATKTKTQ